MFSYSNEVQNNNKLPCKTAFALSVAPSRVLGLPSNKTTTTGTPVAIKARVNSS